MNKRKFTFEASALASMYSYGLIYIVAGIFDFMSGELQKGNIIIFLNISESGQRLEYIVHSMDELLNYYSSMIRKQTP